MPCQEGRERMSTTLFPGSLAVKRRATLKRDWQQNLENIVVVDLYTTINSKHKPTEGHAARDTQEDVHWTNTAFLPVGKRSRIGQPLVVTILVSNLRSSRGG